MLATPKTPRLYGYSTRPTEDFFLPDFLLLVFSVPVTLCRAFPSAMVTYFVLCRSLITKRGYARVSTTDSSALAYPLLNIRVRSTW
ncbi:hypothetical protein BDW74DRAFT_129666 [Aspergillus multicolor]|uniref:uncharacterized protein n=1 Tax=Aspergillus multicolor TaxID=41759 RepID=UPI003CCC96A7